MKIADKLIQEFDLKYTPDKIEGYKPDGLTMIISEFSDLYLIKKDILVKGLLKN
jgi:hypothetical protein